MRLIAVGINHRTAPVALRESLDFRRAGLDAGLEALTGRALVREAVIVSTCNRVELYAAVDSDAVAEACARFLAAYHGVAWETLSPHLFVLRGADAARHLFRVAAGLDSLVVGEPQILGQVKEAFAASERARRTGALIGRAFTTAFRAGKRVRTETGLAQGAVSVSYAAVALARKILGTLEGRDVLILGAGEMAELTAVHLRDQAARRVTVTSRTLATAAALADRLGGRAVGWDQMPQALREADVVVCATGASEPVLSRRAVETAMRSRRGRPLFLVDIAVPRDVDADAGAVEQVFLYNIDDLQHIVAESLAKRAGQLAHAERIVAEELDRFAAWMQSRKVVPTVVALRQRFDAIRQAELRRLEPRLAALPPDARARVDEITHLIVEKLLLAPTEQLKSAGDDDTLVTYADAIARLFELPTDAAATGPLAAPPRAAGESRVMTPLRIGTRGSALAIWQAQTVANRLALGGVMADLVVIRTAGDRLQDRPLSEDGGKRLFVKELEDALMSERVDVAVHSAKDMPSDDPASLAVAAVLPREDPRDALVLPFGAETLSFAGAVARLPAAPAIGTGSIRRLAQIRALVPGAHFRPLRGNVDTRLRKLDAGEFDAIVLAAAGLKRLGNGARVSAVIDIEQCVPAPGQGIVAIQIRRDDARSGLAVAPLNDPIAFAALLAERAVVATLGGGCELPLGAIAIPRGDDLDMRAVVASVDGVRRLTRTGVGPRAKPAALGRHLAEELIRAGALDILAEVRT